MGEPRPFRCVTSTSAASRVEAARAFLLACPPDHPVNIVASTRGAADDLARSVVRQRPATLGVARFSLTQLAARVAAPGLAGRGIAPATALGLEAVAARAVFDAARAGTLTTLKPVSDAPGLPLALARSLSDMRLARVPDGALRRADATGAADLVRLIDGAEQELAAAGVADRARLFDAAAAAVADEAFLAASLVLLDVEPASASEELFLRALVARATTVLATSHAHDARARAVWTHAGARVELVPEGADTDLSSLRTHLFSETPPPARASDGSLEFFSAPGEGRECVEIARRVLREARRGVAFDDMAILVRAPQHYQGLLEHALVRAGVPASFERGTRRPHPAGRAFLALLACAAEGLSANRFAEYLSLAQLPGADTAPAGWAASSDEVFGPAAVPEAADGEALSDTTADVAAAGGDHAAAFGSLRAPRRWEWMLVEAAVIGGDPERWRRRLDGLAAELGIRLDEARRSDPASPAALALERDTARLVHLAGFALPLVREMAAWPARAAWGDWLERLAELAPRVLRAPGYVQRVLADLRPMAAVGPVGLDEVRGVLAGRLRLVDAAPPARRYGCVFVGGPEQARGRMFRVVFVPGLAERMFPEKARQDPLLPDVLRAQVHPGLDTRADRSLRERLMLHLAAGAATERLYVSYPRLDVAESRARVPSFYALDVLRGVTGRVPDHETLAAAAARAGESTLAWPAPALPEDAIDDQEHDLSVLRGLLDTEGADVKGHAQYILRLNPALRRAVTERWARSEPVWSQFDGLVRVTDRTRAALAAHRLNARTYSVSALQRFATCPYQFLLGAVFHLHAAEQPEPLQRLDPLTKGSMVHRMQAVAMRALQARGALPLTAPSLPAALDVLERAVAQVAGEYRERTAPAISRVWEEEIATVARDLRGWLRRVADDGGTWEPRYFELAFGLAPDPDRDPHSVAAPVLVDGRFPLRGAIDAIDVHRSTGALRVTDYKTGKDRAKDTLVIGGGAVLQPVVYAAVAEQVLGAPVAESRLFYCTSAGGYKERTVALGAHARGAGIEAFEVIDRAIEHGSLAPAPVEGACDWCEFRPVCGPVEGQRVHRKPHGPLADLIELRSRP